MVDSKLKPQRKLNLPGRSRRPGNLAGGAADSAAHDRRGVGTAEISSIKNVEEFAAELHLQPLGERGALHQGKVEVQQSGANGGIAEKKQKRGWSRF